MDCAVCTAAFAAEKYLRSSGRTQVKLVPFKGQLQSQKQNKWTLLQMLLLKLLLLLPVSSFSFIKIF